MNPMPAAADPMLAFEGVGWHDGVGWCLRGAHFSVARGSCTLLDGPRAASTAVLRLAARLLAPSEGAIAVAGQPLAALRPRALAALRRSLGVMLDLPGLLDDRSLADNVALAAQATGPALRESQQRAIAALARVGIGAAAAARRPMNATHDERRLALLARALVNRPALLLLDAPTRGLAAHAALAVIDLVDACCASGVTVLVADAGEGWGSDRPRVALGGADA
jgi:cell division transport system ATP-binding protein